MDFQRLAVKEQIVKTVVRSGNGGAVWVPKGWLGEEVIVLLPLRAPPKERLLHLLEPHLKDIISVAIFGSYARHEEDKDSDFDVLVITKSKELSLDLRKEQIDVTCLPIDLLKKAIEQNPAMFYPMLQEADPLLNAPVIEELKKIKLNKAGFRAYLRETKEHIGSNRELINLDEMEGSLLLSFSALYSSMLRLRSIFTMGCLLGGGHYSTKKFKKWLLDNGLQAKEISQCLLVYRTMRDNLDTEHLRIPLIIAKKIIDLLEREVLHLEKRLHGQSKETTGKGH